MRLRYIPYEQLDFIKKNINSYKRNFFQENNESLLADYRDQLLYTYNDNADFDIELTMDPKRKAQSDLKNVKTLYSKLSFLTPSQASDERLWAGLAIGEFWKYTRERWNISPKLEFDDEASNNSQFSGIKKSTNFKKNTKKYAQLDNRNILSHFFLDPKAGRRSALLRNAISRLWWIGYLTYDETNLENPWEITEFVMRNSDFTLQIMDRTFSNNKSILRSLVKSLLKAETRGTNLTSDLVRYVCKYLTILSSGYVLDYIDEGTLIDYLDKRIGEYNNSGKFRV